MDSRPLINWIARLPRPLELGFACRFGRETLAMKMAARHSLMVSAWAGVRARLRLRRASARLRAHGFSDAAALARAHARLEQRVSHKRALAAAEATEAKARISAQLEALDRSQAELEELRADVARLRAAAARPPAKQQPHRPGFKTGGIAAAPHSAGPPRRRAPSGDEPPLGGPCRASASASPRGRDGLARVDGLDVWADADVLDDDEFYNSLERLTSGPSTGRRRNAPVGGSAGGRADVTDDVNSVGSL
ncbi:hypothetical protein M885DRAFT_517425 [Pelagophyceae sp. CCMP2097]|nr:hypothetical protein M885DRAFT_517425 [Pelagophyceae sp. CCMP2097]